MSRQVGGREHKGGMRLKAKRSKAKGRRYLRVPPCSPWYPSDLGLPPHPEGEGNEIQEKGDMQIRQRLEGQQCPVEKTGCVQRLRFPHLVSILSSHTWWARRTGKPHRALHPISASGTNRALLTLHETRGKGNGMDAALPTRTSTLEASPLSSQFTASCPMLTGTPFSPAAPGGPCGPGRPGGPIGPPDPAAPRSPGEP